MAGRDHPALLRDDAATEVRGIELHAPDRLVDRPQLRERERLPDERRRDTAQLQLDSNALDRIADDPEMIERELDLPVQHIRDRHERRHDGIRARDD